MTEACQSADDADEVVPIRLDTAVGRDDMGGDAACWANRVCPECGRLNGAERPVTCEACGASFDPGLPPPHDAP
jgi:hypothetical protein